MLHNWLVGFGAIESVDVEGTGAHGAGLARHLSATHTRSMPSGTNWQAIGENGTTVLSREAPPTVMGHAPGGRRPDQVLDRHAPGPDVQTATQPSMVVGARHGCHATGGGRPGSSGSRRAQVRGFARRLTERRGLTGRP